MDVVQCWVPSKVATRPPKVDVGQEAKRIEKRIDFKEKIIFPSQPLKRPTSTFEGLVAIYGTQH
ncbi:hypothetical protein BpHYR1_027938 [Brachionus plicatilis]|uniref:Uncharacterized protein n=1 Tax=Brachionus plicatilis TaxID=10195 RepID=A0A3M7PN17_BRAPC|nr:hypothetical protein BpHYR1_027938 [Brachionus plicatilis]